VLAITIGPVPEGEAEGPDVTVIRPFHHGEFCAGLTALKAVLSNEGDEQPFIGPWQWGSGHRQLSDPLSGRRVRLTEKETAILRYLAASPHAVSREDLLSAVWGYSPAITTHTLETHIYKLRQKIEPDPSQSSLILTEEGGYRLARP